MQLEQTYKDPHSFAALKGNGSSYECSFCHHTLKDHQGKYCSLIHLLKYTLPYILYITLFLFVAVRCKRCGCVCHTHCKHNMPHNCSHVKLSREDINTPPPVSIQCMYILYTESRLYFNRENLPRAFH